MEQEEKKENLVAVLLVEEGNKPNQPIATYTPGRRIHHLVFMPKDAPVGQQVRVKLVETGKEDSRGNMLYRGVPDVIQYEELWHDNGDGTASLVLYSQNWLMQRNKEGEREKKTLAVNVATPEMAITQVNYSIDWGTDPTSTTVVEEKIVKTPLGGEYVWNGEDKEIKWTRTGYQELPGDTDYFSLTKIGVAEQSLSKDQMLSALWEDSWPVNLKVYFIKDGQENNITDQTEWSKLPAFIQQQLQAEWPLCSCGRARITLNTNYKTDDYPKCSQCRSEEHCERCGQQKDINYSAGHLVCSECQPYESAEQLINQSISSERKQTLADFAKKLLAAQPLEAELGILVLKNNLSHINNAWTQERILDQWKGYQWYYSKVEGFYGTKFSPSALAILQYLPQASGNGLVEMIAWLADGLRTTSDFYARTQVRGEKSSLPNFQNVISIINSEDFGKLVAKKLCGSNADRLQAIEVQKKLVFLSESQIGLGSLLCKVSDLLKADEQDYLKIIKEISKAENEIRNLQRRADLLKAEYSVCPICGGELDRNFFHYCGPDYEVELGCLEDGENIKKSFISDSQEALVRLSFNGENQGFQIIVDEVLFLPLGSDCDITTKIMWNAPTEVEKSLGVRMNELKRKLASIEREKNVSNRIAIVFTGGADPKGEKQMQAAGIYSGYIDNKKSETGHSEYHNQDVIFIANIHCNNWLDEPLQPQQVWSCKPAFQISIKDGWPVIVVNPQLRLDQEMTIRAEIEELQKEVNSLAPEASVSDIEALKAAWGLA